MAHAHICLSSSDDVTRAMNGGQEDIEQRWPWLLEKRRRKKKKEKKKKEEEVETREERRRNVWAIRKLRFPQF